MSLSIEEVCVHLAYPCMEIHLLRNMWCVVVMTTNCSSGILCKMIPSQIFVCVCASCKFVRHKENVLVPMQMVQFIIVCTTSKLCFTSTHPFGDLFLLSISPLESVCLHYTKKDIVEKKAKQTNNATNVCDDSCWHL